MNAYGIQCENDVKIAQVLLDDVLVKQTKADLDRLTEKGPMGVRRRLLSSSVRLSRSMSPAVHKMADHCIQTLGSARSGRYRPQPGSCLKKLPNGLDLL